jgi:hypothetical protein
LTFSGNVQTVKLLRCHDFFTTVKLLHCHDFFTQLRETQNTIQQPNNQQSSRKVAYMSNIIKGELIHSDLVKAQTEAQRHHFWHRKRVENSTIGSLLGVCRMAKAEV